VTARAKRRDDARVAAKVMEKSGAAEMDTVAELAAARRDLDVARAWLGEYKTRLERIAMGLQFVQNRIVAGEIPAASVAIRALMAGDAREAREIVGSRAQALHIAVAAIQMAANTAETREALGQIRMLAPEVFGDSPAPLGGLE
jgi:hypothetical protein